MNMKVGILIAWTGMSCLAGYWYARHATRSAPAAQGRKILYYHDPMHPAYRSDKPGIAPDCGMQLEPVYAASPAEASGDVVPAGAIRISPEKQQLIGVRFAQAEATDGRGHVRLLGRVAVDENRVHKVVAGMDGWVKEVSKGVTGSVVKKHELLATLYGKDLLLGQQSYLLALTVPERLKAVGQASPAQILQATNQLRAAEDGLRALGMNEEQLQELGRVREPTNRVDVRSPVDGIILSRTVSNGQRFERNTDLYRIGQLDRVWVVADVFERDRRYIRPNAPAHIAYLGSRFPARTSVDPPQFDPATRTLKLKLEAENPNLLLRPEMFVDIELPVDRHAAVTVPTEAVLDSGMKKTVFVDKGDGYFESRPVETGWRFGDRVEIVRGLEAGERIVASGNFLIDSESRLRASADRNTPNPEAKDPVCGMNVAAGAAAGNSQYNGATYYFCSRSCKEKFDKHAKQYAEPRTQLSMNSGR